MKDGTFGIVVLFYNSNTPQNHSNSTTPIMSTRIQLLLLIMFSSVLVLLALQAYLSVSDYQRKKEEFTQEVDSMLQRSLKQEFQARLDTLTHYFLKDLNNPDIVRIRLGETTEGELAFHFQNPDSDDIYTSISFRDIPDYRDTLWTDSLWHYLEENIARTERGNLARNTTMYWTDTLGERTQQRRDTLPLDTALLTHLLQEELVNHGIRSPYTLRLNSPPDSILASAPQINSVQKLPYSIQEQEVSASLSLTNPARDILRRTLWTIAGSLAVILLTVGGFYLLFATILQQKKLADLKDDFIDNVTHELQTPLAALRMATESLENLHEKAPADRKQRYLHVARTELTRLSALVDRILERSWADSPASDASESVHLSQFLQQYLTGLRQKASKPLIIQQKIDHSVYIKGSRHQLDVILSNLCQNALNYSDEAGLSMEVSLERTAVGPKLIIADDGWGIPAVDRPHIFDKFTRSSDTNRNYSVKGLGIGLYHTRQCVEAMGGRIFVGPNAPAGTIFTIQFPRHDQDSTG